MIWPARRIVFAIALLAFVTRLAAPTIVARIEAQRGVGSYPDRYPSIAESLWSDGTFGYGSDGATPTTARGPGYALWLLAVAAFDQAGTSRYAYWSLVPAMILAIFGGWALARCGRPWMGPVFAIVVALHPVAVSVAARCFGDEFYAALGGAGIGAAWAWRSAGSRASAWLAAGAAVAFGWLLLTRATGMFVLAGGVFLIAGAARPNARRVAAIVAGLALAPAIAWSIRSSLLERRLVFVESLTAYNFVVGEALDREGIAADWSETRRREVEAVFRARGAEPPASGRFTYRDLTPLETASLERDLTQYVRHEVAERPARVLARWARGFGKFWYRGQSEHGTRIGLLLALPISIVGILGLVRGSLSSDPLGPLFRIALALAVVHAAAYGLMTPWVRHSVQVVPALALGWGRLAEEVARHLGHRRT